MITRPAPGQPYRTQDLHPKFVYAEELNEPTESRERRHAALGVLDDLEMLMFHAVSNNEVAHTHARAQAHSCMHIHIR